MGLISTSPRVPYPFPFSSLRSICFCFKSAITLYEIFRRESEISRCKTIYRVEYKKWKKNTFEEAITKTTLGEFC